MARLQKEKHQALRQCAARSETCEREKLPDGWIRLEFLIHLRLKRPHLRGRRTLLRNKHATNETAVAGRDQCKRQVREEEPETKYASDQDRHSEPCTVEKFVEDATIGCDYTLDEIAGVPFHPSALVAGPSLTQNPRTHQWRERERHKTRGKNRHDNRHRKLAKDAAKQSGDENQRNENRGERQRHREDGKRNFASAVKCRFQDRLTMLRAPHHVFQKDDCVIDKETNRQGQRH